MANKGLYANINARKKKNISKSKGKSTISNKAYKDMQEGWPKKKDGGPIRVFIAKGCGKVMNKRRKKTKEY